MENQKTSGQLELERLRKKNEIVITDLSTCYHCKRPNLAESELFCQNCGFPQRGTQSEQRKFIAAFNIKKRHQGDFTKAVNKARIILFILAGINATVGVAVGLINNDIATFLAGFLSGGIYLGLAIWCKKKPFPAIITGLIVYVTLIIIAAMIDPATIISGIIWKVLIISGFVYGYRGAKEAEHIREQIQLQETGANSN